MTNNEQTMRDALKEIKFCCAVPARQAMRAIAERALAATEAQESAPASQESAVNLAKAMLGAPLPISYQGMNFSVYRDTDVHRVIGKISESAPAKEEAPVAWLHTMHQECNQQHSVLTHSKGNPFGKPGRDYSASYSVTSEPLYTRPAPSQSADQVRDAALPTIMDECVNAVASGFTYMDCYESDICSTCNADLGDGEEHKADCLTTRARAFLATSSAAKGSHES